jgi:cytochrome bd-type quinol oxidase subunit 2
LPWQRAWWSISGIIAAFAGGWAAGLLAAGAESPNGTLHGFLSWAVTIVVVITGDAIATGTAAAALGAMFAPIPTFIERPQETSEAAQSVVAVFSLASFVALLIGAVAATWGGRLANTRTTEARKLAPSDGCGGGLVYAVSLSPSQPQHGRTDRTPFRCNSIG